MKKSYDIDKICTSLLESGYNMPCVDGYEKKDRRVSSGSDNRPSEAYPDSVGKERASVVGCSANNSNPSARTLNGNNALGNGNDNFCGAFAVTSGENGKYLTACPARANSLENRAVTDGYGQCDYGSLEKLFGEDKAESNAEASDVDIWQELHIANTKRKLKNLKRFFVSPEIVGAGVDRCISRASGKNEEVQHFKAHRDEIVKEIICQMRTETYRIRPTKERIIKKHTRDGKDRRANIYCLFDRCVMNVYLIIIQEKFTNIITRNVYSGVRGRSLFSNDRTYCMINQIRKALAAYPDFMVQLTDIHHFYETLSSKVALGVMFKTIVCPFARRLLAQILFDLPYVAIGGTLSQIITMTTTTEMDREILKRYHPKFYGVFGDNRIIIADRQTCIDARSFEMSYLAGRYGMELKDDYSLHKASDLFRFCKYDFKGSTVRPRAELRRNAIRGALRGQQHYAGYKGILMKTDSGVLRYDIEHRLRFLTMKNSKGMELRSMAGEFVKIEKLENKEVWITDYKRRQNGKESGFYFTFQLVAGEPDGSKKLYVTRNGSQEIKEFFKLVETGEVKLPYHDYIRRNGLSYYLEQYHTTPQEACELICKKFDIK